jgi:hypothetical protein
MVKTEKGQYQAQASSTNLSLEKTKPPRFAKPCAVTCRFHFSVDQSSEGKYVIITGSAQCVHGVFLIGDTLFS